MHMSFERYFTPFDISGIDLEAAWSYDLEKVLTDIFEGILDQVARNISPIETWGESKAMGVPRQDLRAIIYFLSILASFAFA